MANKTNLKLNIKNGPSFSSINLLIFFSMIFLFIFPNATLAQSFDIAAFICMPDWYCTSYSEITCGTRTCLDANNCNMNYNKPEEVNYCPPPAQNTGGDSSGGGGGGGSGGAAIIAAGQSPVAPPQIIPSIKSSTDILKIEADEGDTSKKSITLTSDKDQDITISLVYPENYEGPKDLISLPYTELTLKKGEKKDLELNINTLETEAGVVPVIISMNTESGKKTVLSIVNINPSEKSIDFSVDAPKAIKTQEELTSFDFDIDIKKLPAVKDYSLTYTIYSSDGSVVSRINRVVTTVEETTLSGKIDLPKNLTAGYYTLAVTLRSGERVKSRVTQFTVVPQESFSKVEESLSPLSDTNSKSSKTKVILQIGMLTLVIVVGLVLYFGKPDMFKRKRDD